MGALEMLFLINKATQLGFSIFDRVNAGEMTAEEGLALWKAQAVKIGEEEDRFDKLMDDGQT